MGTGRPKPRDMSPNNRSMLSKDVQVLKDEGSKVEELFKGDQRDMATVCNACLESFCYKKDISEMTGTTRGWSIG